MMRTKSAVKGSKGSLGFVVLHIKEFVHNGDSDMMQAK